jgi:hypothetical protein
MSSFLKIQDSNIRVDGHVLRTARVDGEKYCFLDDPEAVVGGLQRCGKRVDLFTFMQRVSDVTPKHAYPMVWDNFAALSITTYEEWWTNQIGFKARNKAKQAEKHGVVLREIPYDESLIQGILEIYNETPIRQGKRFPHYGMTPEQMRRYLGTFLDRSIFIAALFEEKLIGFIKLTVDESGTQAGLMHILSLMSQRDKAPTNALLARAVRSCADRGIPYLVYSNFSYGNKQSDSLSDFKERNGFIKIDVPRYYVPLTPVGRLAFRLGLHRRLTDILPEDVMTKLREIRSAWYSRKPQVSAKVQ